MSGSRISEDVVETEGNFLIFNGLKIFIADNSLLPEFTLSDRVDLVLILKECKINIKSLKNCFSFDEIVIDGTVSPWELEKYKEECEQMGLSYHSVREKGCYIKKLK